MIRDADGNPVSSFSTSMTVSTSQTYTVLVDCETDYELSSDVVAGLTVEAKRTADASWTDIESTPIDLTPWAGTQQEFLVRVTAGATPTHTAFSLYVEHAD